MKHRRKLIGIAVAMGIVCFDAVADTLRERIQQRRAEQSSVDDIEDIGSHRKLTSLPSGVALKSDIAYGDDVRQRMDVYTPLQPKDAPVIVMVHGGAWRLGDKSDALVVENKMARWVPNGFIFISINYRMLPKTDPLHQVDDVAKAVAFAQKQALQWGGDPAKFILMGHSAGAHLVNMLSAAPAKAFAAGVKPWLGTIMLDSGAIDIEHIMRGQHRPFYDKAFGKQPDYWRATSPLRQLSPTATPMLFVCSTRRTDDPCGEAKRFADQATPMNVRVSILKQDLTHRGINSDLGKPGSYTDGVEDFMRSLDLVVANKLTRKSGTH